MEGTMRHRFLWSLAALYAVDSIAELLGLKPGFIQAFLAFAAYLFVSQHFDWQDPPSGWDVKCWRARVFRPSKQRKLWESANKHNTSRIAIYFMKIPKDRLTEFGKIDDEWIAKASFSLDGEMIVIADAVKVRGGLTIVAVSGPPRPRGRGKKRKLPQFNLGRGLLGLR